jgi:hypothetical protein
MLPASDNFSFFLSIIKLNLESSMPKCFAVAARKFFGFHLPLWITLNSNLTESTSHFIPVLLLVMVTHYKKMLHQENSLLSFEDIKYNLCIYWIMFLSHTCITYTFKCDWWWKGNWNWVHDDHVMFVHLVHSKPWIIYSRWQRSCQEQPAIGTRCIPTLCVSVIFLLLHKIMF